MPIRPYGDVEARLQAQEKDRPELVAFAEAARKHVAAVYEDDFGIGAAIKQARTAQGLTQKQLARQTGIDQGDISRIELGKGNTTLAQLRKLFGALNLRLHAESVQH